jgi:ACR3 family arsenite efflux pump ArsB
LLVNVLQPNEENYYMSLLEKLQTLFMLVAIGVGFGLGRYPIVAYHAELLITPALMLMLSGLFLATPIRDLRQGIRNHRFALASLGVNFVWVPVLGWILGSIFLQNHAALKLGFIMLLVTPCTDWYIIFTSMARGNVSLSLSILPLNLVLQVLLLPVYLLIFAGISGDVDITLLLQSVVIVLILPLLLAQVAKRLVSADAVLGKFLYGKFPKMQFFFLCVAIAAMFASQGAYIADNPSVFLLLLPPLLLFFGINFVVGRLVSRFMKFPPEDSISLSLTTLARNSPISLAIAVTAFPDELLVALALVIGPLIELPVLAFFSQILLHFRPKRCRAKK